MYGPDVHSMITGFFRGGHTVAQLAKTFPFFLLDSHDTRALINFGTHATSNISMNNAIAKYGQSQIEFQAIKQLWIAGKYEKAGESAAQALMTLSEY